MATQPTRIDERSTALAICGLVVLPVLGFLIAFFGTDRFVYVGVGIMALSVVIAVVGFPRRRRPANSISADLAPNNDISRVKNPPTAEQKLLPWTLDTRALDSPDESGYQAAIEEARDLFSQGHAADAIRMIEVAASRYHGFQIADHELADFILSEIETQSRAAELQSQQRV